MGAGDDVPEVAVDGVDEEELAVFVPVVAPGVGGAVAEGFDDVRLRMVAPDAAAQRDALRRRACPGTPTSPGRSAPQRP